MPRRLLALSHHKFDAPPKVALLLNCIWPLDPPGELPLPPQAEPVDETCPRLLICKQFVPVLPRFDITRFVVEAPALKVWRLFQEFAVVVPKPSEIVFAVLM